MIDQFGYISLLLPERVGFDRDRIEQVQCHERHVHRVASHVAQGAGAEIPETAPRERMISVGVGPHLGRADPFIPVQTLGDRLRLRTFALPCAQIGRLVQTWTSFTVPTAPARILAAALRRLSSAVP